MKAKKKEPDAKTPKLRSLVEFSVVPDDKLR
jgi:hypothetical protein